MRKQRENWCSLPRRSTDQIEKVWKCWNEEIEQVRYDGYWWNKKVVTEDFVLSKGIGKGIFKIIWEHAQTCLDKNAPVTVDHRLAPNISLSKYGENWEIMIKKSCTLNTSVVITDYVLDMMAESEKVIRGTKYKDDWYIYYDFLNRDKKKCGKKHENIFWDKWDFLIIRKCHKWRKKKTGWDTMRGERKCKKNDKNETEW